MILELGKDININDATHNMTPWMAFIRYAKLPSMEMLKILIDHGADVNLAVNYETPIMRAIRTRKGNIVKMLLEHGADMSVGYGEITEKFIAELIEE